MTTHIDGVAFGTAATIQTVAALPTTGVQNYQQGTLFKLPSGQIFRLTKPIFKSTPVLGDFELLFASGKTPLSDSDIIEVNGNTYFDTTGLVAKTELLVICTADGDLNLHNTRIKNKRVGDGISIATKLGGSATTYSTTMRLVAGEVFYIIYISPSESYYEKLRDPNLADAALEYWGEYWISSDKGLSTNHGKSIEAPYQSVADFTNGWIDFASRVNIMSGYDHAGGWTLADQEYIVFEGAGLSSQMYGGITIDGLSRRNTFRNFVIASDITWGGATAITFSDSGGEHLLEGMSVYGNTAPVYIQFGTNCTNNTADGISTFGKQALTLRDCNFLGSTGIISLPDLAAGNYAYIKLENSQVSGIEVGTGWYVLHDADSVTPTVTYTGTASSANMILTTAQSAGGGGGTEPVNPGGVITRSLSGITEVVPTSENQVLKPVVGFGGDIISLQWANFTEYPAISNQVTNQSGSNMTALLYSFKVSDGNYQSFEIVVDMWESGTGSGLFSRFVKLSGVLRMDLIAAAGTVNIANYIDKDQSNAPKGTLSLVYNSAGYGGAVVELRYDILVPFTGLNINRRVLLHTTGS